VRCCYPLFQSQAGGPPLVSCSQLIEYIHSYLPIWRLSPPIPNLIFCHTVLTKSHSRWRDTRCTISNFHSVEKRSTLMGGWSTLRHVLLGPL
jgi:hypothetical protein